MKRILAVAGTTTASLVAGFALLIFSPVSCGCLTPLQALVMDAGLDYYTAAGQHSAQQIEDGLNSHLAGQKIGIGRADVLGCTLTEPTLYKCRVVADESMLLSSGFDVRFIVKPDDTFVRAQVKRSWSWL